MRTNRTARAALALATVACLVSAGGCGPRGGDQDVATNEVSLTAANEGKAAAVAHDKLVTVRLPSRPATGYVWEVARIDSSVLKLLDEAHEAADGLGGGEATHVHRFAPVGRGFTRLELVYHRPWETDVPPVRTYSVDLDVQGAYSGPMPAPLVVPSGQEERALSSPALTAAELPAHYSVCDATSCTPVKDQGQCGSCWAFATVGVVEQLIKMKDNQTRDISEQYLVSCNKRGWGCNGGYAAFDLFINAIPSGEPAAGAVYEADFPYAASDVACNPPHPHQEKLVSYASVGSTAVADIKSAILAHGPIWTGVCADTAFSRYTGGVFAGSGCTSLNHGVVIVGWDDNGGQGYWIMRNSWGSRWGAGGYMNIRWGANAIASRDNYYGTYAGGGSCTPTTCAAQGKDCGTISDGCGGTLTCGVCTAPQTCGGGGVANVCGGSGQACWTPYARSSCSSYAVGAQVSARGHDWTCASRYCTACSRYSSCAPGATGCPWGAVWTDAGACQ